jgi:hypothetical protein
MTNEKNELDWGLVDKQGNPIPYEYDSGGCVWTFKDGRRIISTNKNGKWGVIDRHNNIMIPFEYEEFPYFWDFYRVFTEDENKNRVEKEILVFEVRKNDKVGFADGEGNVLLPCEYRQIDIICRNSKLYFLTGKGKTVRKPRKIEEGIVLSMRDAFEVEEEIEFCAGYIPE